MDPDPIFTIDTSSSVIVYLLQTTITFHTIQLILCFQQTSETDNLTVRWGKVLSLCCAGLQVTSNTFESFPSSCWFDNLGFLLREILLMCSSYLALGVSQRGVDHAIKALLQGFLERQGTGLAGEVGL